MISFSNSRRLRVLARASSLIALVAIALFSAQRSSAQSLPHSLPQALTDAEFWKMINDFSEPGGFFSSDNFVSNENSYQRVIPALKDAVSPDSVYLGVGPEQNFTYIAALRPRMAFIIDIRRQNMLQHLLYKAAFEMSNTRADFLSLLFSRARPEGLSDESSPADLFNAYENTSNTWDNDLYRRNLNAILENLSEKHEFALTQQDKDALQHIYHAFLDAGTTLSYGYQVSGAGPTPTFAQLMSETDGEGRNWSFLSDEESFHFLKEMEKRNLVVPVVGDFAGPKAIASVAEYLETNHAKVGVFYTSNVERYLFDEAPKWSDFYRSVGKLPIDANSRFIRAVLTTRQYTNPRRGAIRTSTYVSTIAGTLQAYRDGRLKVYEHLTVFSQ